MTFDTLSSSGLVAAMVRYRDVLLEHQEELDALNVFPVPDGDSGTNLLLTLEAVVERLEEAHDMASVCRAISQGALRGARGNSGVILSQFLMGLCDSLKQVPEVTGQDLATALRNASDSAYEAVLRPQEGTMLTVARAAAESAESNLGSIDTPTFGSVLESAYDGAGKALARTTGMLAELTAAGVVDSGGKGLTLLFASFLAESNGRDIVRPQVVLPAPVPGSDAGSVSPRFEVLLILLAGDTAADALRAAWGDLGDSVIVAGRDPLFNCHVHTDRVGAVIEVALSNGPIERLRITDLNRRPDRAASAGYGAQPKATNSASLVLVRGEGARSLFEGLGADVVLDPTRTSVADLALVISGLEADIVVVPSAKADAQLARESSGAGEASVEVVGSEIATEALAAMVAFDPFSGAEGNAATMTQALAQLGSGRVSSTEDGFEGFDRHRLVCDGPSLETVALSLLEHLIEPEREVVTVLCGQGATPALVSAIRTFVQTSHPDLVAEIHQGDQPDPVVFGVE